MLSNFLVFETSLAAAFWMDWSFVIRTPVAPASKLLQ